MDNKKQLDLDIKAIAERCKEGLFLLNKGGGIFPTLKPKRGYIKLELEISQKDGSIFSPDVEMITGTATIYQEYEGEIGQDDPIQDPVYHLDHNYYDDLINRTQIERNSMFKERLA